LYDIFHARNESANSGRLYPALVITAVIFITVAARHGRTRVDISHAQSPTPVSTATVLLTHPLADAQPLHELCPSVENGLLALLLFLLRRGMLRLPVCL